MNKHDLWNDIARSVRGDAWHGPAVNEALAGVTAEEAIRRPPAGLHSVWELTLHIAAWTEEVAERLDGRFHTDPPGGNFVPVETGGDAAWQRARAEPERVLEKLQAALDRFPDEKLGTEVRPGVTFAAMLTGLAQHNAYHAGQIAILRRLLRAA